MERIDMVEKLRDKANVGYEEARAALEAAQWDLLDAMVILEKQGKVQAETTTYSTEHKNELLVTYEAPRAGTSLGDMIKRFFKWLGEVIRKGNRNHFNADNQGERVLSLPITLLVLLLIIPPITPVVIILLIVGLFFGFRYSFSGPELGREQVNRVMDQASAAADKVKDELKKAADNSGADQH